MKKILKGKNWEGNGYLVDSVDAGKYLSCTGAILTEEELINMSTESAKKLWKEADEYEKSLYQNEEDYIEQFVEEDFASNDFLYIDEELFKDNEKTLA